jgi:hypothetical protein
MVANTAWGSNCTYRVTDIIDTSDKGTRYSNHATGA